MHTFMAKQLTFIWELVEKEMYVFIYKDGQENGNVYKQKNFLVKWKSYPACHCVIDPKLLFLLHESLSRPQDHFAPTFVKVWCHLFHGLNYHFHY